MWHQYSVFKKEGAQNLKGQNQGIISGFLVSPKNGQITAFLIRQSPFSPLLKIASKDIVIKKITAGQTNIIIPNSKKIKKLKITNQEIKFLNLTVRTLANKNLGQVKDVIFEDSGFYIFKLFVGKCLFCLFKFLSTEKIIHRDKIVEIQNNQIIVEDDFEEVKAVATETA